MTKWYSIEKDGFPKKDGNYLVYFGQYHSISVESFSVNMEEDCITGGYGEGFHYFDACSQDEIPFYDGFITHWAELPEPPESNMN